MRCARGVSLALKLLTIAVALLVVACGDDNGDQPPVKGTAPTTANSGTRVLDDASAARALCGSEPAVGTSGQSAVPQSPLSFERVEVPGLDRLLADGRVSVRSIDFGALVIARDVSTGAVTVGLQVLPVEGELTRRIRGVSLVGDAVVIEEYFCRERRTGSTAVAVEADIGVPIALKISGLGDRAGNVSVKRIFVEV